MRPREGPVNAGIWMAAVLLPVLYGLSIGPVILICDRVEPSGRLLDALEVVYGPLIWSAENTFLKGPLETYARWWHSWDS